MEYIRVRSEDKERIDVVYSILKTCGWNMAKKFLFHWIPPYSRRRIRRDTQTKDVMLVWDDSLMAYTSTFQMFINADGNLYTRKIATLPKYEGRGIGKSNLVYMENYAREIGCPKICLDVYAKSTNAINFYLHNGFVVVGRKRSIRFEELVMEKQINI